MIHNDNICVYKIIYLLNIYETTQPTGSTIQHGDQTSFKAERSMFVLLIIAIVKTKHVQLKEYYIAR